MLALAVHFLLVYRFCSISFAMAISPVLENYKTLKISKSENDSSTEI